MTGNVWVTKVTDAPRNPSTEQVDVLGSHRWIGNKCYKYVKLPASQSSDIDIAANGDALGYSDFSAHTVVADATDADEGGAGAVVNFDDWDGDMTDVPSYYMWIQIKGVNSVSNTVGGTVSIRERIELNTSSTDLTWDKCTTLKESSGYVTIDDTEVYLNCPY